MKASRVAPRLVQLRRHRPRGHDPPRSRASEVDAPAVVTRLLPDGSALVDVTARVRNRGDARDAPAHRDGSAARPLRVRARSSSAAGARRRCAPRLPSPRPEPLGPRPPGAADAPARRARRVRLAVEGRPARDLRWAAGACCSTAPRSRCAARRSRRTPQGRGDALRPDDMDAIVAPAAARSARTRRAPAPAQPGAARAPRRGRHPRLAGHRPGRLARRVDGDDARAAPPGPAPRAPRRRAGPDPPERADLEPRQRGRQQRPRRRPGAVHRLGRAARAPPRSRAGRSPSTSGARTCPTRRRVHVPQRRRDRRHELRGLVRRPAREPGGRRREDRRRGSGACTRRSRARCSR